MRLLVELGADPLMPNDDGTTPLMVAAGVGTSSPGEDPGTEPEVLEAVKVALEFGGDVKVAQVIVPRPGKPILTAKLPPYSYQMLRLALG
jgi:hypothetical protein